MKRPIMVLAVLAFLAVVVAPAYAQIKPLAFDYNNYSGPTISANTTWGPAECPGGYIVTGNLRVVGGATLTILPGTTVRFNPTPTLTIEGALVARGTAGQPITFTTRGAVLSLMQGVHSDGA